MKEKRRKENNMINNGRYVGLVAGQLMHSARTNT
jgi:hypothetical protein